MGAPKYTAWMICHRVSYERRAARRRRADRAALAVSVVFALSFVGGAIWSAL